MSLEFEQFYFGRSHSLVARDVVISDGNETSEPSSDKKNPKVVRIVKNLDRLRISLPRDTEVGEWALDGEGDVELSSETISFLNPNVSEDEPISVCLSRPKSRGGRVRLVVATQRRRVIFVVNKRSYKVGLRGEVLQEGEWERTSIEFSEEGISDLEKITTYLQKSGI